MEGLRTLKMQYWWLYKKVSKKRMEKGIIGLFSLTNQKQ